MDTIGIFHTKGGVGKSAVAVFLADFLSTLHGKRVLVVDLDPQGSSSRALVGRDVLDAGFRDGKSLPGLLKRASESAGPLGADAVQSGMFSREAATGRMSKRTHYLGELKIFATDRTGWRAFADWAGAMPAEVQGNYLDLLKDLLAQVEGDFDLALVDFPGSEIPFWTKLGLRASGWWLLPELPDFVSVEDIGTTVDLVHDAEKNSAHKILPLGTLLTICPNRGSSTYRRARASLEHLAMAGAIPPLYGKDAEILHRPDAQKATDWKSELHRTLAQRYGSATSPFVVGLKKLAAETLKRTGQPEAQGKLSVVGELRRTLTDYWRG